MTDPSTPCRSRDRHRIVRERRLLTLLPVALVVAVLGTLPQSVASAGQPELPCSWSEVPPEIVLRPGPPGSWDAGGVWSPSVGRYADEWMMWYMGSQDAESGPVAIGLATSRDGRTWTREPQPGLASGAADAWDAAIGWPSVVQTPDGFHMWYVGFDAESSLGQIGHATSSDGRVWSRSQSGPVLAPGGDHERGGVSSPAAVYSPERAPEPYQLFYVGHDGATGRFYRAVSTDGQTWQRPSLLPILGIGQIGAWDWPSLVRPSVVSDPEGYIMAYSAWGLPGYRGQIGFATSTDGIQWQRAAPVIEGRAPFERLSVDFPALARDADGSLHLWYNGYEDERAVIVHRLGSTCDRPQASRIFLPVVVDNSEALGTGVCTSDYRDDFSDPASGWGTFDEGGATVDYLNGTLRMVARDEQYILSTGSGAIAKDFHLEVDARSLGPGQGFHGLLFGWATDELEYRLLIWEREFALLRMEEEDATVLQDWTPTAHLNAPPAWNRLRVRRVGDRISVAANGHAIVELRDDVLLREGHVGFVMGNAQSERFEVRYDNFKLRGADCRPGR